MKIKQTAMNNLLKLEELGQFLLSIILFSQLEYAWWVFPVCLLLPDVSMIGYLVNPKTGAWIYNFFHHKMIAVIVLLLGFLLDNSLITLAGVILFGHSAMDRIFGYGLKFNNHFQNTHLGWVGNQNK
ncbi:protein of unknown function [Paenimyroides aquimaris]|uniref:DUF4260 family protein n=1 Tax=Paenimyroides marinum TaxID=1159016 RepID=A0A1H6JP14_9FLAO|nr:DUF4260 domain-containing protein [Paenimyroides aquimaris]SEH64213.1 protein of unknown function [Paenimyroides aquimaris]